MSQPWDQSSADVAAAAEHERADLAQTLDRLRENLQPRNVVDEVMSHAGVNAETVSDQIGSFAKANPVAAAIVGIGAAMFFATKRGDRAPALRARQSPPAPAGRYPSGATPDPLLNPDVRRDVPGGYPRSPQPEVRPAGSFGRPSLDGSRRSASDNRLPMNTVSVLRHPQTGLLRLIEDQPLVLAALGIALGAAIGAVIPPTAVESRLMGDANEAMRRNAQAAARTQLAQLRATATETFEQMKSTVADHGATSENLSGLVHDLGDDVRAATQSFAPQFSDRQRRS